MRNPSKLLCLCAADTNATAIPRAECRETASLLDKHPGRYAVGASDQRTQRRKAGRLLKAALRANIIYDPNANGLVIRFGSSQPFFKQGHVELASNEGAIAFDDGKTWSVRFSEKNEVRYMTIVDSQSKTVYYTCL